jgi:hypothetical protein
MIRFFCHQRRQNATIKLYAIAMMGNSEDELINPCDVYKQIVRDFGRESRDESERTSTSACSRRGNSVAPYNSVHNEECSPYNVHS